MNYRRDTLRLYADSTVFTVRAKYQNFAIYGSFGTHNLKTAVANVYPCLHLSDIYLFYKSMTMGESGEVRISGEAGWLKVNCENLCHPDKLLRWDFGHDGLMVRIIRGMSVHSSVS